ncbi:uncharacterized protein LOC129313372 [Prosopis cineraria]|uniref:uncharacterized protein LOC129313372 n=1 Tax=Prosopis cineraria TaxID=364024 RepID=UPI00240FD965|nr:uncharacterized protein LOC129313372 [Prosopis cineraria]
MDANVTPHDHKDQEEYILLDLDGVSGNLDIPPNAKYVLTNSKEMNLVALIYFSLLFATGLDTLNPVLIIDDKLKLVGEYEETIGTCIVFTEEDTPVIHEETGPSEVNLFSGTKIIDSSQPPKKQVKPSCQLHKVLKFRISPDSEMEAVTTKQAK